MLTDVTVVQRAVSNLMGVVDCIIDVFNRMPILVADPYFSFSLFALLDQIKHQDRARVSFHQVFEMMLRRGVGRIDSVDFDWRLMSKGG